MFLPAHDCFLAVTDSRVNHISVERKLHRYQGKADSVIWRKKSEALQVESSVIQSILSLDIDNVSWGFEMLNFTCTFYIDL